MTQPTNLEALVNATATPEEENSTKVPCEQCGRDIPYAGVGRKPKRCEQCKMIDKQAAKGAAVPPVSGGNSNVNQAVATLESLYGLIALGLTLAQAHEAAAALHSEIPKLNAANAKALSQDKELVKIINKAGSAGGRAQFVISNVATLAPVALLAAGEISQQRNARRAARAEESATYE